MKGTSCIPENLFCPPAGLAETDSVMRTGMPADSIRARGPATALTTMPDIWPQLLLSVDQRVALATRGGPYMAMANKIARIAYAVIVTGKPYDPAKAALANG